MIDITARRIGVQSGGRIVSLRCDFNSDCVVRSSSRNRRQSSHVLK
jgi:hypothetical protein